MQQTAARAALLCFLVIGCKKTNSFTTESDSGSSLNARLASRQSAANASGVSLKRTVKKNTLLVGDPAFACEAKAGSEFMATALSPLPTTLETGGSQLNDSEFIYLQIDSDLNDAFKDNTKISRPDSSGAVPCDLKRVIAFKADIQTEGEAPPPTTGEVPPGSNPTGGTGSSDTSTVVQNTSSDAGTATVSAAKDTYFKQSEADSRTLTADKKCQIKKDSSVSVKLLRSTQPDLLKVQLLSAISGGADGTYCAAGSQGFIYIPDFSDKAITLSSARNTVFKSDTVDSTTLASDNKCAFNGTFNGTLLGYRDAQGIGYHLKVTSTQALSGSAKSSFCDAGKTGFLFIEHFLKTN